MNKNVCIAIALLLIMSMCTFSQDQTVGLFTNEAGAFQGYTFFAPTRYKTTYLIDMQGRLVQKWESDYTPGLSAYLLENGKLLRTLNMNNQKFKLAGGSGGRVQIMEWDGTVVWEYEYSSDQYCQHHDVEMLPNGNVLMIAWELKDRTECIDAGRDPSMLLDNELWPDHIIEVQPNGATGGTIVWEWHIWDHLVQDYDSQKDNYGVVKEHPELLDVNYETSSNKADADWNHTNAIDYNEEFDQVLITLHDMNEIFVIDHSTTTEEAAGHSGGTYGKGGDILYRWGNPIVYGMGTSSDRKFFLQHDAHWIESGLPGAGNILVFNNGVGRVGGNYSSIDEIVPPVDNNGSYLLQANSAFGPDEQEWLYVADNPADFYAVRISGAQRLANGNTIICSGPEGRFFEITPDNEIVWEYVNPVTNNGPLSQGDPIPVDGNGQPTNGAFRCYRYAPDYPGLAGHDLTPGDPIELDPWVVVKHESVVKNEIGLHISPNPFNIKINIYFDNPKNNAQVKIFSIDGKELFSKNVKHSHLTWKTDGVPCGVYVVRVEVDGMFSSKHINLVK